MDNEIVRSIVNSDLIFASLLWLNRRQRLFYVGEGGHDRTVKVKRAVARELCTPGL